MRSWQIRNILTTIALAVCCGVATAGPESAASEQPSGSSEVKSETKQTTKSTAAPAGKGGTKATATAKTKAAATAKTKAAATAKTKAAAPAKTKAAAPAKTKAAAPAKTKAAATAKTKAAAPAKAAKTPHRVTGGGVGVLPSVPSPGSTTPDVRIHGIKERARWAPPKPCLETDKKLQSTVRAVDKEASKKGDRLVMARIAAEFRTPAETILAERTRLSVPWGELLVAHTLLASAPDVTVDQLFDMRHEGLGWGQISYGLGLNQKEVVTAVQAEGRVARGKSKPDGSPARIASLEPRVVVDETAHAGSPAPEVGAVNVGTSAPEPVKK